MKRQSIPVAPALGSRSHSYCSRNMSKRQMCSGGGGEVSQGKEAGDSAGFWNDKSSRNALFLLGGTGVGLCMYNSIAANPVVIEEKNTKKDHEEATERHEQKMERLKERHEQEMERLKERHEQVMEPYRQKMELNNRFFKVQTAVDDARLKLIDLEPKVMILEHEVKDLATSKKAEAAAEKMER